MGWIGKKAADVIASGQQIIDGTITAAKLVANAVTYAKMQQVSAGKVLGRDTSGTGNVQELPIVVDTNGFVGIGRVPSSKALDILTSSGAATAYARILRATNAQGEVGVTIGTSGGVGWDMFLPTNSTDLCWYNTTGGTNMRLDTSGNLKFNSGFGSAGPAYGCRAWVNYNSTGTVFIRGSGNISSLTDNGAGDVTLNFITAMPDGNYSMTGTTQYYATPAHGGWQTVYNMAAPAAGSCRVGTGSSSSGTDCVWINVAIFR